MNYELDVSKWVCGGHNHMSGENFLGKGRSRLLNHEGYMCCLGQFAEQHGIAKKYLLYKSAPVDIRISYSDGLFYKHSDNTRLSTDLMKINDDPNTTPIEKIERIRAELEKHGHGLKVINAHILGKWKDAA